MLRGLDDSGGGLVDVWRVSGRLPGGLLAVENFSPRVMRVGWSLCGRVFLGYACAGLPGEAFPAFVGWLLGCCWLWGEL